MTKKELEKIVIEKGGMFSGCGCCYEEREASERQGEFIDVLWNKINENEKGEK
jgi:hypothetical protein